LPLIVDQLRINCDNCGAIAIAVCSGGNVCERCRNLRCCNGCRRYLPDHCFDDNDDLATRLCQVGYLMVDYYYYYYY